MADRFDKFTERARRVLSNAQEEAHRLNHNYIDTGHILLGLLREVDGVAVQVLKNLGVKLNKLGSDTADLLGRTDRTVLGEIGLTPRAKKVIELAVDEARRMEHSYVGTEHILLGLVREGEGLAAGVLESLGVNIENARFETKRVLGMDRQSNPTVVEPKSLAEMSDQELDEELERLLKAWEAKVDEMTTAFQAYQTARRAEIVRQKERGKELLPPENEDQSGQTQGDEWNPEPPQPA